MKFLANTFRALIENLVVTSGTKSDDVVLRVTPLYHVMGGGGLCFLDVIVLGARIVLASTPFDVNKALEAIQQEHVTRFYAVPAVSSSTT